MNYSMPTSHAVPILVMLLLHYPSFPLVPPKFITSSSKVLPNTSAAHASGEFASAALLPAPPCLPTRFSPLRPTRHLSRSSLRPPFPLLWALSTQPMQMTCVNAAPPPVLLFFWPAVLSPISLKLNPLRPPVPPKLNSLLRSPPPKLLCTFVQSFQNWIFNNLVPPSCTKIMMPPSR